MLRKVVSIVKEIFTFLICTHLYKKKGDLLLGNLGKVKVMFALEQATKAQSGSRGIILLIL
jgi:hypothetical protein